MKALKTLALALMAMIAVSPALSAKEAPVVPADDLNPTEQQLVGKWQEKISNVEDGISQTIKSTYNLKADRTYSSTFEMKATFPLGDPENNSIFVTAQAEGNGTWSANEKEFTDTPDASTIKSSVSANCTDQTLPGVDEMISQVEQMFTAMMKEVEAQAAKPSTSEITSLVLKTLVLTQTDDKGEKQSSTYKRVK